MFVAAGIAGLIYLVIFGALFACWLYGVILSLRASILLTIVCFFLHVPFIIFGLVKWLAGVDVPQSIVNAFRS